MPPRYLCEFLCNLLTIKESSYLTVPRGIVGPAKHTTQITSDAIGGGNAAVKPSWSETVILPRTTFTHEFFYLLRKFYGIEHAIPPSNIVVEIASEVQGQKPDSYKEWCIADTTSSLNPYIGRKQVCIINNHTTHTVFALSFFQGEVCRVSETSNTASFPNSDSMSFYQKQLSHIMSHIAMNGQIAP